MVQELQEDNSLKLQEIAYIIILRFTSTSLSFYRLLCLWSFCDLWVPLMFSLLLMSRPKHDVKLFLSLANSILLQVSNIFYYM